MTEARGMKRLSLALHRRRSAVIVVGLSVLVAGTAIVFGIPSRYRAETAIKVIDARPPSDYVQPSFATPAVSDVVGERMKALHLHILNRPLILRVAEDAGLTRADSADRGRVIEEMRDRFEFRVEGADTFTVGYLDSDPKRAEYIVNRISQLFMDQENQEIEGRARGTTKLLEDESKRLKAQLEQADAKIRDFKVRHYGALPEQQEENLRNLDQSQLEVNILETTLQTTLDRRRLLLEGNVSPLRKAEDELSHQLETARSSYTPSHPEVKRLEDEYGKVRTARVDDEKSLRQHALTQNPDVLAVGSETERLRSRITELRHRQALLREKAHEAASNQQSLAALSLDYDSIKEKYQALQGKLRESELSQHLARDFRPFRFSLLEPAARPIFAASPNRPLLALMVVFLAGLLALGAGVGLELVDPKVRDASDLEQITPHIPVLAAIPRVGNATRRSA